MMRWPCTALLLGLYCLCGDISAQSPSVPTIPDDDPVQINVEATIYRTNLTTGDVREYTAYFEEYLDAHGKRGLAIETTKNREDRFYYDMTNNQGFNVSRNRITTPLYQASCITTNFNNMTQKFGGFGIVNQNGKLTIANTTQFLKWSLSKNPVFVSYEPVRGINATKWQLNVSNSHGTEGMQYTLTYWFSYNHVMPHYDDTTPVPLRLEMEGNSSGQYGGVKFHHIYDFSLFAPLGDVDDTFFAPPKGVFCPNRIPPVIKLSFPDQYSMREEMMNFKEKTVNQIQTYFDYNLNLTRADFQLDDSDATYGVNSFRVIHDFTNNLQLAILSDGTCNVTRIPLDAGYMSWDVKAGSTKANIEMAHTRDIMRAIHLSYQGKRVERGIDIDVWSNRMRYPNGTTTITEMWFTSSNWKVRSTQSPTTAYHVLIGFYTVTYDRIGKKSEIQSNIYDQYYGPLQRNGNLTTDIFDVPQCYRRDALEVEHINFNLFDPESTYSMNMITQDSIIRAIRGHFSSLANISPTRITDIEIYPISQKARSILKVYFLLRSKIQLTDGTAAERVNIEAENAEALTTMEVKLAQPDGMKIPVTTKTGSISTMIVETLLFNDEGSVAQEIAGKDPLNPMKTYTPAAMAGLGIGMLLLGAILTIAVGGILWIKRFDINIPYLTQNNE